MILGWDIGGVNTKAARVDGHHLVCARGRAFELQRAPAAVAPMLRELAWELGADPDSRAELACAVTMTAELSQMFRTKREGVGFVIDAVESAFPSADISIFAVDAGFVPAAIAREQPLAVAAANWAATARLVGQRYGSSLLIDVGSTTTDLIPIVDGRVAACGKTDPERLAFGELVYSGAVRTPVEAIVRDVPYRDGVARVSAEGFALTGDVHVWRGALDPTEYTVAAPDGRPPTREFARERIARVICADREMLDDDAIAEIADAIAKEQSRTISSAIRQVLVRHPGITTAVITGVGAFIADIAGRAEGLSVIPLAADIGDDGARYAPAAAVALLYADCAHKAGHGGYRGPVDDGPQGEAGRSKRSTKAEAGLHEGLNRIDMVIKVGGGLLSHADHFDRVLSAIGTFGRTRRVLIVAGGGPFADAVRKVDAEWRVSDDAAHWMAILGMDQFAHLIAARLDHGVVTTTRDDIMAALARRDIPVLAPSRWLAAVDPLPHTWDVTSDSIAAWVTGELRATELVLVKPPGARGSALTDPHFSTVAAALKSSVVAADDAPAFFGQLSA